MIIRRAFSKPSFLALSCESSDPRSLDLSLPNSAIPAPHVGSDHVPRLHIYPNVGSNVSNDTMMTGWSPRIPEHDPHSLPSSSQSATRNQRSGPPRAPVAWGRVITSGVTAPPIFPLVELHAGLANLLSSVPSGRLLYKSTSSFSPLAPKLLSLIQHTRLAHDGDQQRAACL